LAWQARTGIAISVGGGSLRITTRCLRRGTGPIDTAQARAPRERTWTPRPPWNRPRTWSSDAAPVPTGFFFLRFFRRLGFVRDAGRAPAVVDSAYFWDSAMLEENRLLMSFCHVYRVISPGRSVL
jgi:hypothetical protein